MCGRNHHLFFHFPTKNTSNIDVSKEEQCTSGKDNKKLDGAEIWSTLLPKSKTISFSTAIVKIQDKWSQYHKCRAAQDTCSQGNFITRC